DDTVTNARCWLVSPLREYMSPYANSMIYFDTSGAISLRFSAICKCVVPVSDVYVINLSIPCWYLVFSIVYHSHVFIQIYLYTINTIRLNNRFVKYIILIIAITHSYSTSKDHYLIYNQSKLE